MDITLNTSAKWKKILSDNAVFLFQQYQQTAEVIAGCITLRTKR